MAVKVNQVRLYQGNLLKNNTRELTAYTKLQRHLSFLLIRSKQFQKATSAAFSLIHVFTQNHLRSARRLRPFSVIARREEELVIFSSRLQPQVNLSCTCVPPPLLHFNPFFAAVSADALSHLNANDDDVCRGRCYRRQGDINSNNFFFPRILLVFLLRPARAAPRAAARESVFALRERRAVNCISCAINLFH